MVTGRGPYGGWRGWGGPNHSQKPISCATPPPEPEQHRRLEKSQQLEDRKTSFPAVDIRTRMMDPEYRSIRGGLELRTGTGPWIPGMRQVPAGARIAQIRSMYQWLGGQGRTSLTTQHNTTSEDNNVHGMRATRTTRTTQGRARARARSGIPG